MKYKNTLVSSFFALLFLCSSVFATEFTLPKSKIQGNEQPIELGELVYLNISPIEPLPPHFISVAYHWKVLDGRTEKRVRENSDGSIVFGAGVKNKEFDVIVSAVYLFAVREGDKPDGAIKEVGARQQWITGKVTIGAPTPPAPPTPPVNPPTPDEPVFPVSKFGLGPIVYKLALADGPVTNIPLGSKALSSAFEKTSKGKFSDVKSFLLASKTDNNTALIAAGVDPKDWDKFSTGLMDIVYKLYEEKKLSTLDDFSISWKEISFGLSKVK